MSEYFEENEEDWEIQSSQPPRPTRHVARDWMHEISRYVVIGTAGIIAMFLTVLGLESIGVGVLWAALAGAVVTTGVAILAIKVTDLF